MIAELHAVPGRTPIADVYRKLAGVPADPAGFDRRSYDPRSIAKALAHWRKRMVDEYVSTTVFSALAAQLVEANASLDASFVALKMAQDEFRHAELCGVVAGALGGTARARIEAVVEPLPRHEGVGAEERALRNVIVTSISETYSAAFFVASLDRMTDPFLRGVTRSLLADETLHGQFGFHYLGGCADWLRVRADVRASLARYLRAVFAKCEQEFVRDRRDEVFADDARLGLVPADVQREVFHATMTEAVVPGLEAFGIDAERAFAGRATLGA